MTTQTEIVPGYRTGTWTVDSVHSDASFVVRHLGVAKVRGQFEEFEGTIVTAADPLQSTATATVKTSSVHTHNPQRDAHVRSADFLDTETFPTMTFTSTAIRPQDSELILVDGDLTLRGVTRPVTFTVEVGGFGTGLEDSPIIGLSASTEIKRSDFGVTGGAAGAAVSDKIKVELEIEAVLQ